MYLRDEWKFPYSIERVYKAAIKQKVYHAAKVADWTKSVSAAEEEVQKSVKLTPIIDRGTVTSTQYVNQPQYDANALQTLRQAQERLKLHQQKFEEFMTWERVLENALGPITQLELTYDDVVYFGLSEE